MYHPHGLVLMGDFLKPEVLKKPNASWRLTHGGFVIPNPSITVIMPKAGVNALIFVFLMCYFLGQVASFCHQTDLALTQKSC
ncbi:hypothetical protein [Moraxella ovis]|uniref:hypothetical protein n=1 Tax=Moraxella ovis TaxID=29433 RepID=UPI0011C07F30|nr:hypothetical protein [Moraxella ovis]